MEHGSKSHNSPIYGQDVDVVWLAQWYGITFYQNGVSCALRDRTGVLMARTCQHRYGSGRSLKLGRSLIDLTGLRVWQPIPGKPFAWISEATPVRGLAIHRDGMGAIPVMALVTFLEVGWVYCRVEAGISHRLDLSCSLTRTKVCTWR
jgi:hypothetical protein